MIKNKLALTNKLGLHARAASKFVDTAKHYTSTITVTCNNKQANGKSIMDMMMLAATQGSKMEVMIEGEDETESLEALEELVKNRFGEDE
jgi:phosphocarrier protein HPr